MTPPERLTGLALGIVRGALGLALFWAALAKLRAFAQWRRGLASYGLRGRLLHAAAVGVIAVEVAAATVVLSPAADRRAGLVGACLGAIFLAVQSYLLAAGGGTPCLCFGNTLEPVSARSWAKAALVLLAGLALLAAGSEAGWSWPAGG